MGLSKSLTGIIPPLLSDNIIKDSVFAYPYTTHEVTLISEIDQLKSRILSLETKVDDLIHLLGKVEEMEALKVLGDNK